MNATSKMSTLLTIYLLAGVLLAAVGQVLFKVGATGHSALADFVNLPIIGGLFCYGLGTVLWILALSKAPLTVVYPFTALTFVLVYAAGVLFLGETASMRSLLGIALILVGLFLVSGFSR
jgi:drug/metabolite transporter (DMT)-like permease